MWDLVEIFFGIVGLIGIGILIIDMILYIGGIIFGDAEKTIREDRAYRMYGKHW